MFKFYLIVMVMSGTGWKANTEDGWHPREQPDWKVCIQRRDAFNKNTKKGSPWRAICRKVMN